MRNEVFRKEKFAEVREREFREFVLVFERSFREFQESRFERGGVCVRVDVVQLVAS